MPGEAELDAAAGLIAPELKAEFPGLRLDWLTVRASPTASPRELKYRLRALSSRYRGATVVAMRTQPITQAYRSFFHQIGLDPDVRRVPSEQAALHRLLHGGFTSSNLIDDARLIALIETGVPVWALDAEVVDPGGPGSASRSLAIASGSSDAGDYLAAGRLAVADTRSVHALLFDDDVAPGHGITARSERVVLFAIGVDGVPAIHIEEALWICMDALARP